jgi:ABC-2 type transport system permease protein/oleandomycin transport system permease protein
MARMAVLGGRTVADLTRNIGVVTIITFVGMAVGFRPTGSFVSYIQACLLMLIFAYCISWGFAFVGLAAPNSETAQAMTFPLIFPLTFASSIFVQVHSMPSWLRPFANNQPVSQCATAVRGLMLGTPHGASTWITLAWAVGAIAVLAPLATAQYRKVA